MVEDNENIKNKIEYKKNINSKIKTPLKPLLKKKNFDDNLVRFNSNYIVNEEQGTKFFKRISCEIFIKNDEINNKNIIKNVDGDIKKKKKRSLNFLYYILNILVIAIVLIIQLSKESDPSESIGAIKNVDWSFIFIAFCCFAVGMILEQVRYAFLIHKATGVFRFGLAYKVGALGRYYDTITPLGTGGQPFQVLYTNRYGIKAGEGISIAMGKYIFYELVYFVLVSYFVFRAAFYGSYGSTMIDSNIGEGLVSTLMWIGYIVLALVVFFMTFISLNRKVASSFIIGILKLLNKIKIGKFRVIKDYRHSFNNVMRTVNLWQKTTRKYSKSFWVIFVNVVGSVIYFFINYSMPFFIFCAFSGWHPDLWETILTFAVMIELTSAFNPIPMGTGTADLSFTVLYGYLFAATGALPGAAIWALLIWRFFCYYIYILQGLVIINYDYFIGNKRLEKYKDVWMLPIRERIKLRRKNKINK